MRYKIEMTLELKSCSHDDDDADGFDEEDMIRFMLEGEDEFNLHDLPSDEEEHYKRMVYDLCSSCHKIFLKDPLFKNVRHRFGFREN